MFYVYELVDPRDGLAFYVGKGKGRRAWTHAINERRGNEANPYKAARLKAIRTAGQSVRVNILADGLTETEAFAQELALIRERRDALTNIAGGTRSPIEVVRDTAKANLAEIKPLCQLLRERASPERLLVWRRVVSGLARIAATPV